MKGAVIGGLPWPETGVVAGGSEFTQLAETRSKADPVVWSLAGRLVAGIGTVISAAGLRCDRQDERHGACSAVIDPGHWLSL